MAKSKLAAISIDALQAEIDRRLRHLASLRAQREQLDRQIEQLEQLAEGRSVPRRAPRAAGRATGKPLLEYAKEALAASSGGMRLKDLEAAVLAAGYPTRAESIYTPLSVILNKDPSFQRVARGVYKLRRTKKTSKKAPSDNPA